MQLADRGGLPVRRHRFQVISSSEVIPKKTIVSCETVAGYVGVDLTRSICSDEVIWSDSKMQKQITSKRDQLDELAASGKKNVNSNYTCEASKLRMKIAAW
jgi:hypothetical protein